jgi:SAM-dependent methyltransferase
MFTKSARFYDALYSWKDYPAEAREIERIVARHAPSATSLLDVACGTGLHLAHLVGSFELNGMDLDPGMLELARSRVPEATFYEADMASFDLGRRFGAIICMFSSIGYMRTTDRLQAAFGRMSGHLDEGGVVVVEPWFSPEEFEDGRTDSLVGHSGGLTIERTALSSVRGTDSIMDFSYEVSDEKGAPLETFDEKHVLGLFTGDEYEAALSSAGLELIDEAQDGPTGRGLYVAKSGAG